MTADWERSKELFAAARELGEPERRRFLEESCAGEPEMLRELTELLASHEEAEGFLAGAAIEQFSDLVETERPLLETGKLLGQYEIVKPLGQGGMGEVYLAKDRRLNRKVAVKLLPSFASQNIKRFEQEVESLSSLNHPNILTIHDFGSEGDEQFMVSEFVDGVTLSAMLKDSRLTTSESLDIAYQILAALAAAHEAGIIHRDIKPENIMIRRDGLVKVLDFGIAKLADADDVPGEQRQGGIDRVKTNPGALLGSIGYMSPEQARGSEIDARSDIFSLGVVLYEMLAGRPPFAGEGIADVIEAIRTEQPDSLGELHPETPPELEKIVEKCLAKDRENRFTTAREAMDALLDVRLNESQPLPWKRSVRSEDNITGRVGKQTAETASDAPPTIAVDRPRRYLPFAVAAFLAVVVLGIVGYWFVAAGESSAVERSVSDAAHQAYLRGRFFWNKRTGDDMKRAIAEFESALKTDPNYALAYVGLADCYTLLELYTGAPASETLPKAREYALKAIELDAASSEAHTSLGYVYYTLWQWGDAERHLKRAVELDAKNATAHHRYYLLLRETGRMDRAAEIIARARELDPLSLVINLSHARLFLIRGDTETCIDLTQKLIQLYPNYAPGHTTLGSAFIRHKRFPEALAEMEKAAAIVRNGQTLSSLGYARALVRDVEGAERVIQEMRPMFERREILGREVGLVYVGLGRYDEAFEWLETDFRNHSTELPSIVSIPELEPIRKDPRFVDLVRRMGLPEN